MAEKNQAKYSYGAFIFICSIEKKDSWRKTASCRLLQWKVFDGLGGVESY